MSKSSKRVSILLERGLQELTEIFQKQTESNFFPIVTIDEYDWPHRQRDSPERLRQEIVDVCSIPKCSTGSKKCGLFVMAGLTRIVREGNSVMNNKYDAALYPDCHGLCGITKSDLLNTIGKRLDEKCTELLGCPLNEYVDNVLVDKWNGFRFATKEGRTDFEPLFSPIDVWGLIDGLHNLIQPESLWIDQSGSEFLFVQFEQQCTWEKAKRLARLLRGGWIESKKLTVGRPREDYFTCMLQKDENDIMATRVFYELGFLSIQKVGAKQVLLAPPNTSVYEDGLSLLISEGKFTNAPSQKQVSQILQEASLNEILQSAAKDLTRFYGHHGRLIREYAMQDQIFFKLRAELPPFENAKYKIRAEMSAQREGKKWGRMDMVVFDGAGTYHIFEMKLNKKAINRDLSEQKLSDVMEATLYEAAEQVGQYYVKSGDTFFTNVKFYHRWAVGAVWYGLEGKEKKMIIQIQDCGKKDNDAKAQVA